MSGFPLKHTTSSKDPQSVLQEQLYPLQLQINEINGTPQFLYADEIAEKEIEWMQFQEWRRKDVVRRFWADDHLWEGGFEIANTQGAVSERQNSVVAERHTDVVAWWEIWIAARRSSYAKGQRE